jgi:hypothetical protein
MATKKKAEKKPIKKFKALPAPSGSSAFLGPVAPGAAVEIDPQLLLMTAVQSGAPIDVIERLMDLRRKLKAEEAEVQYREAMASFQSECPIIPKKKVVKNKPEKGGGERYRYAPIEDIVKIVKPIMVKHGFSYKTETNLLDRGAKMAIEAVVVATHVAGHSERSSFTIEVEKSDFMTDSQSFGSAQTFAQRYAFRNAFGIVTGGEDDDGNWGESQAKRKDAEEKISKLPDKIKSGFRILGYTPKTAYAFCEKFGWDNRVIDKEIEKIITANEKIAEWKNGK